MKVDLISFQDKAVKELRLEIADACDIYRKRKKTQVVSLQAPTGAGKTIIAAALIEAIYTGMTLANGTAFEEQPDAIFVWLSDSPELNEQSKQKIELKTSKLRIGQCVTINEDSFDCEELEDGKIYFLNTQKISKTGNLTKHSDGREYTIWDTLDNTIANKGDHLYFIIDEAHRGAKTKAASGTDTTIMQRFIKGYEYYENGEKRTMQSMPVVLGISATLERFTTLISTITNVNYCTYVITADDVRASGLLKERIVITYPEDEEKDNDLVLLDAAVEEWQTKCKRWHQYTYEQHYANVDPVLVVQVCQGTGGAISDTDIDDVVEKIEAKCGEKFKYGEVVHCLGYKTKLTVNGLDIPHVNATDIAGDHRIKVVLFKEALSTGWDCPRAETMMSFATRNDPTYIAQLLGRMVRTPLQMRVTRDEFLNDVKLYLPHFNKDQVKKVIDELNTNEGGEIPTEINGQSLAEPIYITYTVHTQKKPPQTQIGGQTNIFNGGNENTDNGSQTAAAGNGGQEQTPPIIVTLPAGGGETVYPPTKPGPKLPVSTSGDGYQQLEFANEIDREKVIDYINKQGFITYMVRHERINDYLKSLLDIAGLLTHNGINTVIRDEINDYVVGMMRSYIEELHANGSYDALSQKVLEFKLSVQIFDPFGNTVDENSNAYTIYSEDDLDRQVRLAEAKLGRFGFTNIYAGRYMDSDNPTAHKIDCVLFAADDDCMLKLGEYAKNKLDDLQSEYRHVIATKPDAVKKKYHNIIADSEVVSKQLFAIPETVVVKEDADGTEYDNHLLAEEKTGKAKIKLNGWESALIEEEAKRPDFVCWLRNPVKASWALCLTYEKGGETKQFYPDFLIIRKDVNTEYIVDILEPHGEQYADNLPKAKALAKYAREEINLGRIQLIHKVSHAGGSKFIRLDFTKMAVQNKVLLANTDDELSNIFTVDGISGDD